MKNTLFRFPLGEGRIRGIEKGLFGIILIGLIFISSCKKEVGNVIVEGRVINLGTQQPIEGVTVVIENEVSFTPSHLDSTFTDADGNFHIELPNEKDAWIYLRKDGWTFHSSSLNNVTGYLTYYPNGITSNVKLEMYPDAWFGGVFENENPTQSDTFYFNELPYSTPISYGG
ncbi:MAG: hypothetical protein ACPGD5_05980, partial [Salibacteraceae bacterium]